MNRNAMACFALLWACGGDDAERDPLVGEWLLASDGPYDCAVIVTFSGDGGYTYSEACALESGGIGAEVWGGTYEDRGDELALTALRSSCAGLGGRASTDVLRYTLDGDTLTLATPDGAMVLERAPDEDDGGQVSLVFGCWGDDGSFTQSPVSDF